MSPVKSPHRPRRLVVLGSTGSIGVSTLDVVGRTGAFRVVGLAARRNVRLLAAQVRRFTPRFVAVEDRSAARALRGTLGRKVEVLEGPEGVAEAAGRGGVDTVVSAIVGSAGLRPTYEAVRRGRVVAFANKETLVAGGEVIARAAERAGARLLPVDSEHSAIFQCLDGRDPSGIRRIMLTGSGGPFRGRKSLAGVTVREALRHPTWNMGRKVTIDSATLMNKGLEIIEARWLFHVPVRKIDVIIHPQSIVHSMVEFADGSILAQMGRPDMRVPILYALSYPERLDAGLARLDLMRVGTLTFEPPDPRKFPCLRLAREAAEEGGSAPVVLNAANEMAVQAFLDGRIPFTGIPRVIERTLATRPRRNPRTIGEVLWVDREARWRAAAFTGAGRPR